MGNLVVGGTGKTPIVIWLTKLLERNGYKPGIVIGVMAAPSPKNPIIVNNETVSIRRR